MLLIIELLLLVTGIWAIVAGKIPSILFGGTKYKLEGWGARSLGVILVIPLPTAIAGSVVLTLLLGDQATPYAVLLEFALVIVAIIAALIVSRFVRQPAIMATGDSTVSEELSKSNIEAVIAKKSQGSLIYALLGILGFSAILVCPLAFIRANQALGLIDKHQVGEQYRGTANAARIIASIIFLFYAAIVLIFLAISISGL